MGRKLSHLDIRLSVEGTYTSITSIYVKKMISHKLERTLPGRESQKATQGGPAGKIRDTMLGRWVLRSVYGSP